MITGEEHPDDGDVSVPKKLSIGYFRQDVEEMSGRSVLEEAIAGSGRLGDLHHELMDLEHALADPERAGRDGEGPRALRRGAARVPAAGRVRAGVAGRRRSSRGSASPTR